MSAVVLNFAMAASRLLCAVLKAPNLAGGQSISSGESLATIMAR